MPRPKTEAWLAAQHTVSHTTACGGHALCDFRTAAKSGPSGSSAGRMEFLGVAAPDADEPEDVPPDVL